MCDNVLLTQSCTQACFGQVFSYDLNSSTGPTQLDPSLGALSNELLALSNELLALSNELLLQGSLGVLA